MKLIALAMMFAALPAFGANKATITSESYGCVDKERYRKINQYGLDQDQKAFFDALGKALATGQCASFKKGEQVFLIDSEFTTGLSKIRKPGKTVEYWLVIEDVKIQ